jgi:hypothetical protein
LFQFGCGLFACDWSDVYDSFGVFVPVFKEFLELVRFYVVDVIVNWSWENEWNVSFYPIVCAGRCWFCFDVSVGIVRATVFPDACVFVFGAPSGHRSGWVGSR